MNLNFCKKMAYENKHNWTLGQNKPNSNPISSKAQMNVNSLITKDYKNFIPLAGQKNKPNSNPILSAVGGLQMNANVFFRKDYENKTAFRHQQNKPNQTQLVFFRKLVPAKAGILCSRIKPKLSPPASKLEAIYLRTGKNALLQAFYCQGGNAKKS